MTVIVEMYFEIEPDTYEEFKKIEHHIDYILNLDEYPEIKTVYGVSVKKIV